MHLLKSFLSLTLLFFLCSCQSLKPFNKQKYSIKQDIFYSVYHDNLLPIQGMSFDSKQVSNKFLDREMIHALIHCNNILANPKHYYPELETEIKAIGINKITIASASRSPKHQFLLNADYKASYLKSFHLLGLAVDLEMRGKPFDFRENTENQKHYDTLEKVLRKAGLVFSEPKDKDPNHVELYKYCKKKNNSISETELYAKEASFLEKLYQRLMQENSYDSITKKQRNRLIQDIENQLFNHPFYEQAQILK